MYRLKRPAPDQLHAYMEQQAGRPVFQSCGAIPDPPPAGFRANRGQAIVGRGGGDFAAGREVVRRWGMFPTDWVQVDAQGEAVRLGQTVAVVTRCLGIWTANCCRVVNVQEHDREFAFTYATTDQHALQGAERFTLEWRDDDSVWFGIHAVARPRDWCVWPAYAKLRQLQQRFAAEAPACVKKRIQAGSW